MNKYVCALLEVLLGAALGIAIGFALRGCDAHAQGYENICTCERFPVCWYKDTTAPADWTWIPWGGQMLRWQVREFGAGWTCSHGMGG